MRQVVDEPVEVEVARGRTIRSSAVDRACEERLGGRPAAVARLAALALEGAELFRAPDGRGWARIDPDAHLRFPWLAGAEAARCEPDLFPREMPTRGVDFPRWLAWVFYDAVGKLPTRGALDAAVERLDEVAREGR